MALSIETALEEHRSVLKRVASLEQDLKVALEREAILKGRIEQLDMILVEEKARSEHYMRWCTEIIRQMMNINMFVSNAMKEAKVEVEKGNGKVNVNVNMDQLEKEMSNEPVHSEESKRRIPNFQGDR